MGLHGQHPAALRPVAAQDFRNMPIPLPGRHHLAAGQRVLNVEIFHIGRQQLPGFQGFLPALDKIGRIEDGPQGGQLPVDIQAAGGCIAVNPLFVFMAENDRTSLRLLQESGQPIHHLVPVKGRIASRRQEKAEQPDTSGPGNRRRFQAPAENVQMGGKILFDADFAQGTAQGPHPQPLRGQPFFERPGLPGRQVGNVFAVYVPRLQIDHAVFLQRPHLLRHLPARLVGKRAEHRRFVHRHPLPFPCPAKRRTVSMGIIAEFYIQIHCI